MLTTRINGMQLTVDELACINLLADPGTPLRQAVNARLCDPDRAKLTPFLPLVKLMLTALSKLAPAPPCTLFRGIKGKPGPGIVKGAGLVWQSLSSAVVKGEVMQSDECLGTTGERTIFSIAATCAYDTRTFYASSAEAALGEHVIPPNTVLVVESVLLGREGLWIVKLRQLPPVSLLSGASAGAASLLSRTASGGRYSAGASEEGRFGDRVRAWLTRLDLCLIIAVFVAPALVGGGIGYILAGPADLPFAHHSTFPFNGNHAAKKEFINTVVAAMRADPLNAYLQRCACSALAHIANQPDNQKLVAEAGGIEAVVAAMRAHPTDEFVQQFGSSALAWIANHPDNQVLVAEAGGIEAVVAAMRSHPSSEKVQIFGCTLLGIIASQCRNQSLVAEAGGIEAVVHAMRAFANHVEIQTRGCLVLHNIASPLENKPLVAEAGGVEVVVAAMRLNPSSENLQICGCRTMERIAAHTKMVPLVISAGGIEAVVRAMQLHAQSVDVQQHGCMAVGNVAALQEAHPALAKAGSIQTVLAAMRGHPDKAHVQVKASFALNYLSLNPANRPTIARLHGVAALRVARAALFGNQRNTVEWAIGLLGADADTRRRAGLTLEEIEAGVKQLLFNGMGMLWREPFVFQSLSSLAEYASDPTCHPVVLSTSPDALIRVPLVMGMHKSSSRVQLAGVRVFSELAGGSVPGRKAVVDAYPSFIELALSAARMVLAGCNADNCEKQNDEGPTGVTMDERREGAERLRWLMSLEPVDGVYGMTCKAPAPEDMLRSAKAHASLVLTAMASLSSIFFRGGVNHLLRGRGKEKAQRQLLEKQKGSV